MEERDKGIKSQSLNKTPIEQSVINGSFSLMDGASAQIPVITPELSPEQDSIR